MVYLSYKITLKDVADDSGRPEVVLTVHLPTKLYAQLAVLAHLRDQDVAAFISSVLQKNQINTGLMPAPASFPPSTDSNDEP